MSKPRSLRSLLSDQNGGLQRLLDRAHRLAELDERVRAQLPSSLAVRCRVSNVRAGTLIIQTESAAVHGKLRFLLPRLLRQLQQDPGLRELTEIEVRVAPRSEPPSPPVRQARLSADAARLLESSAEATTDPKLRRSLQRLAGRRRR